MVSKIVNVEKNREVKNEDLIPLFLLPMRDSSALLFEPYQYQGLLLPNNTTGFLP